jgi:hypothetical protein
MEENFEGYEFFEIALLQNKFFSFSETKIPFNQRGKKDLNTYF